jgi:hypothetical protein
MAFSELDLANKALKPFLILLLLSFFNFDYLFKSVNLVANTVLHKPTEQFRFGKPLQLIVNNELVDWLKAHKIPNAALLSIGWDESQVLYYLLQEDYAIMNRQSHFFYYKNGFDTRNKLLFDGEEKMLMEDLKQSPPLFIIDHWKMINSTKATLLQKYVDRNYALVLNNPKYKVYQKNP